MTSNSDKNIFHSDIDELHSFDAYYRGVILRNNNLVIPYINLGVSQHPVNPSKDLLFFDFSFMIFQGVNYLDAYINSKRYKILTVIKNADVFYSFGGTYLDYDESVFNDMRISCDKAYLQILSTSRLSKTMWLPIPTPNFKMNMSESEMNYFFDFNNFPDSIKGLLK